MSFTDTDLREVLEDRSAALPANPDRYGEVRRRVRGVARRRTAGAACLAALVVAAGTGVMIPRLGDDGGMAVTPTAAPTPKLAPGSEEITLLPEKMDGLPLVAGGQFDLADRHRIQLTFVPKSLNFRVVVRCDSLGAGYLGAIGPGGDSSGPCTPETLGSVFGPHAGAQGIVPGSSVTWRAAVFPYDPYIQDAQAGASPEDFERLLNAAAWPDGEPRTGSWAVGVYDAAGAKDREGMTTSWDRSGDATGPVPRAVDTASRPVTVLPESYRGQPRRWGEQHPADGRLRRLTVSSEPGTWLVMACEQGAWYVQRLPNGHFTQPGRCAPGAPEPSFVSPVSAPGGESTVEVAVFPASTPKPEMEAQLVELMNDPPAGSAVEWALGTYQIPEGYDGP